LKDVSGPLSVVDTTHLTNFHCQKSSPDVAVSIQQSAVSISQLPLLAFARVWSSPGGDRGSSEAERIWSIR
jgi:hypothetical protein